MSMSEEEVLVSRVWGNIINEIRKLRAEKRTLSSIAEMLQVSRPTIMRWIDNTSGGEKTAFVDILRYMKALSLNFEEIAFAKTGSARQQPKDEGSNAERLAHKNEELARLREQIAKISQELISSQKENVLAKESIIKLHTQILELEKHNTDIKDKTRRALAAIRKANPQGLQVKKRLAPGMFPDLPPIHLE